MTKRVAAVASAGVTMVSLLALSDNGAPAYHHGAAEQMAALGVPAFTCTPDQFPSLMAAVLQRRPIADWAATQEITTSRSDRR